MSTLAIYFLVTNCVCRINSCTNFVVADVTPPNTYNEDYWRGKAGYTPNVNRKTLKNHFL